jgi:hypothetical protein
LPHLMGPQRIHRHLWEAEGPPAAAATERNHDDALRDGIASPLPGRPVASRGVV